MIGSIDDYFYSIYNRVNELEDAFIFETISKWAGKEEKLKSIIVSKEILSRALICFKEDHKDEYFELCDKMIKSFEESEE